MGIECYCYNEPNGGFPICYWEWDTCSGDACYVHRELLNGVFYTTWNCLIELVHHNIDLICQGSFNAHTEGYACCNDADRCNRNLKIVLPIEVPNEQILSTINVTSTATIQPRPSSTFTPAMPVRTSAMQPSVALLESSSVVHIQSTRRLPILPSAVSSTAHASAAVQLTSVVPESTSVPSIKGM